MKMQKISFLEFLLGVCIALLIPDFCVELHAAPLSFQPKVDYPSNAGGLALGDVNGDNILDIVAPGYNSASVLLGNGNGTFKSKIDYPTNNGASSVGGVLGDVNGDGNPDIVAPGITTVSVLLGNGNGTFKTSANYQTHNVPQNLALGDLNGDGKPDIAVACHGNSTVDVLLGNGDGTFRTNVGYPTNLSPTGVALGDVNGDGKPDLAVSAPAGVDVLLGNGDGTFKPYVNYPLISNPSADPVTVTLGDVNGDGKLDLLLPNSTGYLINVLLGNGDGTFKPFVNYTAGGASYRIAAGDVNGDFISDLVVTNWGYDNAVNVLLGNGDGTFQPKLTLVSNSQLYGAPMPSEIAIGDMNGDGRPDLVFANQGSATSVSVLLNATSFTATNARIACLFNWGSTTYPSLLSPTGNSLSVWFSYVYHYYSATNSFLAFNAADNNLYYIPSSGQWYSEGPILSWFSQVGC